MFIIPFAHKIVLTATNGLFVTAASNSQQDNTIVMKWHSFFRTCTDLQKLIMTTEFKHLPEKKKNTLN